MYLKEKNNGDVSLIEWDWKENPSWLNILNAIDRIQEGGLKPQIIDVDTKSDQNAVILAPITFDRRKAQEYYNNQDKYFTED